MGTIAQEIARIQGAKADLKTAIESKGVTVPSATLLDGYADLVDQIPTGGGGPELPTFTGHVDTVGLTALGWDAEDIAWLQAHVWWNEEDDAYWAVTAANLAFGPNGATPLTWENRATVKTNPDVRFFPKFDPSPSSNTSWNSLLSNFLFVFALPTHGWDTTYVTHFSSMFAGCHALVSCGDLSGWNTGRLSNMANMFQNCYNLRYIGDLRNWNRTGALTALATAFQNCNKLYSLGDLSGWNITNINNLTSLFQGCYNLRSLDLSSWDVGNVTGVVSAFADCWLLQSVGDLSNWNTGKFTSMQSTFYNCRSLISLGDLSGWDTKSVTSFQNTFTSCGQLTSLGDLSQWDTSNVTSMVNMFSQCNMIDSVGDISGWNTGKVTSMQAMFSQCRFLQKIDCSAWDVSKVTNVYQTFHYCTELTELDLYGWDLSLCTNVGTTNATSIVASTINVTKLRLGPKFFNGTPTTYYFNTFDKWTRESIYESLYTNQTLRGSNSTSVTVKLGTYAYDRLTQQDIADIATKNITLTRG